MTLDQILKSVDKKYEKLVVEICNEWRKKVQEGLKDLMKLSMRSGVTISFKIEPACPSRLKNITLTNEEYIKFILFQNRPLMNRLRNDLPEFSKFIEEYAKRLPLQPFDSNSTNILFDYVSTLYDRIPSDDEFIKKLMDFNEDVFGTYLGEQKNGTVTLYWSVIGLFTERWNVDIEGLTNVILSHEYAHAYTHLAVDANNINWDVHYFRTSDRYIVEGLAEYYSSIFIAQQNKSDWLTIYNLLLGNSPEVYKDYKKWEEPSLEAVRYALSQAKRIEGKKLSYTVFKEFIRDGITKYGKMSQMQLSKRKYDKTETKSFFV